MSFVIRPQKPDPPDSPEALFRELRPRDPGVRDLLLRQGDALRAYHQLDDAAADVAIELPTGAGKTLVGLLVAEWRRLALDQRVAYLCPTVQLANQAVAKAHDYGLDVVNLAGSHRHWDPPDVSRFTRHQAVAVATYSTVFNSDPKLGSTQTLILDDAHAGEGPVSSTWSISAQRGDGPLYAQLLAAVIDGLPEHVAEQLRDDSLDPYLRWLVELVPPTVVFGRVGQINDALKAHAASGDDPNFFARRAIGNCVNRCLMYVSWNEILMRPLIPPTLSHAAFSDAEQRVYMSATLGGEGELERAFGVPSVARIQVPAGVDEGGFGRRFFVLPNASHPPVVADGIIREAVETAGRVAVVGPSFAELESFSATCLPEGVSVLHAEDVQDGLDAFTSQPRAALLLANRYDGIDLPGEDCRLVVLTGLPANTHLQERFLLETVGARRILSERIRTRLVQGAGRATRGSRDFAAILIRGASLTDFCSREEEIEAMPPQVQAELRFGLDNSENPDLDPSQLLRVFWDQGAEWDPAEAHLTAETQHATRREPPGSAALGDAAPAEVECWRALWGGDLERAVALAQQVTDRLSGGEELRPYRALWFYLASAWAQELASQTGDAAQLAMAQALLREAVGCTRATLWHPTLPGIAAPAEPEGIELDRRAAAAAATLRELGIRGTRFASRISEIEEQIGSDESARFEEGLRRLGELLGFDAVRPGGQAVPDGAWRDGETIWLIFEAKTEEQRDAPLSVSTVRQSASHHRWVTANLGWTEPQHTLIVIISPREAIDPDAAKLAADQALVTADVIRDIARRCVTAHSEARAQARGLSNEALAADLASRFDREHLDTSSLVTELGARRVSNG
jgi:hypothetical protein